MTSIQLNKERLFKRLLILGELGKDERGRLSRTAATDADKAGRDQLVNWMLEAGLEVEIDRIGNIFGIWRNEQNKEKHHIMIGSHIDTVIDAGIYDGTLGVLAGLEVIESLKQAQVIPTAPVTIAAFTNEEGVRFTPDMMGSLVFSGGLPLQTALETVGTDGEMLGKELNRIGYAGNKEPGHLIPQSYIELHIEQGPILENTTYTIGAVDSLQGISWQEVTIEGRANHAGTTPMEMRKDALLAASEVIKFLGDYAQAHNGMVATVGSIKVEPDAINVIPSKCVFTVDLRNPDEDVLQRAEEALSDYLNSLSEKGLHVSTQRLARFEPVSFDLNLVSLIEEAGHDLELKVKRMCSGAGHDAQMMARICPSAMIFVPSKNGISHNPKEHTHYDHLEAGANVLLEVTRRLIG